MSDVPPEPRDLPSLPSLDDSAPSMPVRRFDAASERERLSRDVLKKAIDSGRAAELLEALTTGGHYGYNRFTGELVIQPRTYISGPVPDAVRVTMPRTAAKSFALAVLDPDGVSEDARRALQQLAEKIFLVAGREAVTDPVAYELDGFMWDEAEDSVDSGAVAIIQVDTWHTAEDDLRKLQLQCGVPSSGPPEA